MGTPINEPTISKESRRAPRLDYALSRLINAVDLMNMHITERAAFLTESTDYKRLADAVTAARKRLTEYKLYHKED